METDVERGSGVVSCAGSSDCLWSNIKEIHRCICKIFADTVNATYVLDADATVDTPIPTPRDGNSGARL